MIASPPSHSLAVAYSALLLSRLSRSCAVVYSALLLSRQLVSFFALASPFFLCVSLTPTGIMLCPHTLSVAHSALCLPPTQPVSCVSFYLFFSHLFPSLILHLDPYFLSDLLPPGASTQSPLALALLLQCLLYPALLTSFFFSERSYFRTSRAYFESLALSAQRLLASSRFCLWLLIWHISSLALLSDFLPLMFFYGAKRRHRREAPPQARSAAAGAKRRRRREAVEGAKRRRKCLLCFIF